MATSTGYDKIPDHLLCPVCYELPEAEVYQCRDGHMACKRCYFKLSQCPQCRDPLDRNRPIRNRPFEEVLEKLQIHCSFKVNGCNAKISRRNVKSHENECHYDFTKFGSLVNICKNIGFNNCHFTFNNGSTKTAVEHLVNMHGCILTNSKTFKMELTSFKENALSAGNGNHYWTPIISDLEEEKCFFIILAVLNQNDAAFTWLSIFLPYPTNENRKSSPVQMEYTVQTIQNFKEYVVIETPVSLSQASAMLPNQIRLIYSSKALITECSKEDTLRVKCNIKRQGPALDKLENIQSFVCNSKLVVSSASIPGVSYSAHTAGFGAGVGPFGSHSTVPGQLPPLTHRELASLELGENRSRKSQFTSLGGYSRPTDVIAFGGTIYRGKASLREHAFGRGRESDDNEDLNFYARRNRVPSPTGGKPLSYSGRLPP